MALTAKQLAIMEACRALGAAGRTITRVNLHARTKLALGDIDRTLRELMILGLLHRRPGPGAPCYLLPTAHSAAGEVVMQDGVRVTVCPPGYAAGYGWGDQVKPTGAVEMDG